MKQNPYAPPNSRLDGAPQAALGAESTSENVIAYFPHQLRTDSSAVAIYGLMLPLFVMALFALLGLADWALPAGAGTGLYMLYRHRRAKSRPAAVLEVSDGRLRVTNADRYVLLEASFAEVLDVSLDTRTIQRVSENTNSSIPDLRFAESVVHAAQDESRIEIKTATDTIFLTEKYLPSIDTTEWFGKIRKLLRRNGWVPQSERNRAA